ncbi:MAG TPA: class I SAM-dependent rRNA methyltransferase [Pyrinomonadaceae bacterium]|jgi:23S rRNA (cytosine1962-C5)-methyltransferase|nr:class I SAM-dependent rRNA methyltransferase [Pyrinomonadaceae bacterium]
MENQVTVTKRGADRIRGGHLWIYSSDVVSANEAVGGAIVVVRDQSRNFVGQAFFSDSSQIALRFLTQSELPVDRAWWQQRILAAANRRANIIPHTNAYRLVYSEGDLLPSIIIDRYDDVLVLQTLSQGSENIKPLLVELLAEQFQPRAIIERNDVRVRQHEGLELVTGTLFGETPDDFEINQDGVRFLVSPLSGQKTGSFLDQRENRIAARAVAHGRALDCFTFAGAFALNLAGVCESVIGIDISAEAIAAARQNAQRNDAGNVEFREANVFDALRELESAGERFDTIVLDPPAFAKNRASAKAAARGYKEINLRAIKLLSPGGILVTCTCSYHMPEAMFLGIIAEAANDAHRTLQLVEKRTQASDHPILMGVPETYYLKCVIARVLD